MLISNHHADYRDYAKINTLTFSYDIKYTLTMRTELLKKIKADLKTTNLNSLASAMDMDQPTLWRLVYGESHGRMDTWEKIQAYYKRRKTS